MIRQALSQGMMGALQEGWGVCVRGGQTWQLAASNLGALIQFRHYTVIFLPTIKNNNDSQLCNYLSLIKTVRAAPGSGGRG